MLTIAIPDTSDTRYLYSHSSNNYDEARGGTGDGLEVAGDGASPVYIQQADEGGGAFNVTEVFAWFSLIGIPNGSYINAARLKYDPFSIGGSDWSIMAGWAASLVPPLGTDSWVADLTTITEFSFFDVASIPSPGPYQTMTNTGTALRDAVATLKGSAATLLPTIWYSSNTLNDISPTGSESVSLENSGHGNPLLLEVDYTPPGARVIWWK